MPAQTRPTPTTTTSTTATGTETAGPTTAPPDLSSGRGNGAAAADMTTAGPESSLLEQEPTKNKETRSGEAGRVTLSSGKSYVVSDKDMEAYDPWMGIAQANGCSADRLQAFNQHVQEVNVGGTAQEMALPPTTLAVGVEIYIPSAQELAFAECRKKAKDYDEAIALYGKLTQGPNIKMLDAAKMRASGKTGEAYGTAGDASGNFYTPNAGLAGAKSAGKIDGVAQYKVFWLKDFWKCSVFMNDVVFQAGYKPALMENKHYSTAGNAHKQPQYKQVKAKDAMPGDAWQKYGGTGSDESHNAVLSTFVEIADLGDGTESWKFNIIGSEQARAAESTKECVVDKATNQVTSGYGAGREIRFLRPTQKR